MNDYLNGTTPRTLQQAFGPRARLHVPKPSPARRAGEKALAWFGKIALVLIGIPLFLGCAAILARGVEVVL